MNKKSEVHIFGSSLFFYYVLARQIRAEDARRGECERLWQHGVEKPRRTAEQASSSLDKEQSA
jgi:hypothetical protein